MKKKFTLVLLAVMICTLPLCGQVSKTINITSAGTLNALLTSDELNTVTNLTLTGQIDQRDFVTMRDKMAALANIDMKGVSVMAYSNYPSDEIPEDAFYKLWFVGKQTLKSIILPETVTSIGGSAFCFCHNLAIVILPKALITIKEHAFYSCKNIISLDLPASLTTIGDYAFYESNVYICKSEAKTPPTVESNTFTSIRILYVPQGTKESYKTANYWKDLFIIDGTETAHDVVVNEGTTLHLNIYTPGTLSSEIEAAGYSEGDINYLILEGQLNNADILFIKSKMTNLCSIDLSGTTVTTLPANLFSDNIKLANIKLPETLIKIPDNGFKGCLGLTSIELPIALDSIGKNAFNSCSNLKNIEFNDSLIYIGDGAFNNCIGLTNITFPSRLTSIGNTAFQYCINLKNIELPESIISLGDNAFLFCINLTNTKLPNSITSIGKGTFGFCTKLTDIVLPQKLTSLGDNAFYCCTGIKRVVFPGTLTYIGGSAFRACTGLSSIELPETLTFAGSGIFAHCSNLTKITLPTNSLTEIKDYSFQGCCNLTSINLPKTLTYIGSSAFQNCIGLSSIELPDNITNIGNYAFAFCIGLTNITFPKALKYLGESALQLCTGLTEINLPDGVDVIMRAAFDYCTHITNVNLPAELTYLQGYAFNHCFNLKSVCFSTRITDLGDFIFTSSNNLSEIKILNPNPPRIRKYNYPFETVDKTKCKLIVPKGSIEAYKSATGWNEFINIIELDQTGINSLSSAPTKAWAANGMIYISSEKPMDTVELFTLSGKAQSKIHVGESTCQIEMNNEKMVIIKITYLDGSSETIKVVNNK